LGRRSPEEKPGDLSVDKVLRGKANGTRALRAGFPSEIRLFYWAPSVKIPIHQITRFSLFIALGVTFGFALMHIPNVELVTATVFIGGFISGVKGGVFIGAATEGIFSLFHPLGAPPPPLWIAQVVSMAVTGAVGGFFFGSGLPLTRTKRAWIGAAGFLCTLNFAVLTTLAYAWTVSFSIKQILASLTFGLSFYLIHLFGNTIIFFILVPAVLKVLAAGTVPAQPDFQGKS
jgi:hypothetical protein